MDDAGDEALLAHWGAGDAAAGETLFSRHFSAIFRFFCHRAPADADELIQQTFLGAVQARTRFRGDSSFRTFLFAIARRQLLKHYEAATRRKRLTFRDVSMVDLGASAETRVANSQLQARLLAHLQRLPADYQTALELHYWEGLPVREVAEVLDAPVGTVKRWMHEARKQLADALELDERKFAMGPRPAG